MNDPINHPAHYTDGPVHSTCGDVIECIDISETFGFCRGNAIKYLWRAGRKADEVEDLKKARWYLDREIIRLEGRL